MWLIPLVLLTALVGMVLTLIGANLLEDPQESWGRILSGLLCLFGGVGTLVQLVIVLLEI